MTTIYLAGGEDIDFFSIAGAQVDTTTTHFRSTFARCGLRSDFSNGTAFWQNYNQFVGTPTEFWFSARFFTNANLGTNNQFLLQFADSAGLTRLRIRVSGSTNPVTFVVEKINTAGSATQLGSSFNVTFSTVNNFIDKFDIHWKNAASGDIEIYFTPFNGSPSLVYSFSGDTTTETTAIAYVKLFSPFAGGSNTIWSEIIVVDSDTRNWSLQTLAPVANGNTHNFDTGSPAAANVNEITLNDTTLDGSTTAGQIDQYTIPALASGTWTIIAIGVSARILKGSSGPSKMDLGVRNAGGDFWSSDQVLTTTFFDYQNWWLTDPNTGVGWAALPTNIGLKSVI